MFCKNCGKELKDGAKFCASCGAQMPVEEPVATENEAKETPAQQENAEQIQPVEEAPAFKEPIIAEENKPKKGVK